jgi:predicted NAD/FAD-binding protein
VSRQRIAVIGAGIAGLSAAWLLRAAHEVTLFEAEPRLGGHADTHSVVVDGAEVAVDMGFIVLNDRNYPNLSALFELLGVPTQESGMSFSASIGGGRLEYGGATLGQVFGQRRNLLRPRFWRMLADIMRFYREAPALLQGDAALTLGEYLRRGGYSDGFVRDHILPMGGAIWSAPLSRMRQFPARNFVRFFHNHGLLTLSDRPQWRTVTGGSRVYVQRVAADLRACGQIRVGSAVRAVTRDAAGVHVRLEDGAAMGFDRAVLACHADQALSLLEPAHPRERAVLGAIHCADNLAVLHSDPSLMPRRRKVWSAWNYLAESDDEDAPVSLTYWMNLLQNLPTRTPLFVTLNPRRMPDPALVHATRRYRHPQFDAAAAAAQLALPGIQGADRLWFAGAWTGWGFHEDGIASAVRVAESMGVAAPWAAAADARLAA